MKVFLDNNSGTKVEAQVIESIKKCQETIYGAPGSDYGHSFGIEAYQAIEESREIIAKRINANPSEIVFSSGNTESNNHAIKGIAFKNWNSDNKLIVASNVSHSSILESLKFLDKFGFTTKLIDVDSEGYIKRDHLEKLLAEKPLLVSIPHGNIEIGTIEDIEEISKLCHKYNVPIHIDASASFCKIPIDVKKSDIDIMTISAHLIHGPKGMGALYIKKGVRLEKLLHGGLQEKNRRSGIENVAGIVGFGKAVSLYTDEVINNTIKLQEVLLEKINENLTDFSITGPKELNKRIPGHLSLVINYVEGESVLLHLDMAGFMIATGSACSSKKLQPSHVLTAIGLPTEISHGSIRIGLSKYNTTEEITNLVENLAEISQKLRDISPVDEEFMREWQEMKAKGLVEDDHDHHDEIDEDEV